MFVLRKPLGMIFTILLSGSSISSFSYGAKFAKNIIQNGPKKA